MTGVSRRLVAMSIRHPLRVVVGALLVTLVAAGGLPRLELRTDGRALVPADAPEVAADRAIRERFGVRDVIAVVLWTEQPGGIFDTARLGAVERLTARLQQLEGVRPGDVASLATERSFRRRPAGLLAFRNLLEPLPATPEQLELLRDDLRRIELYDGTLIAHDGSSAAILLGVPPEADRVELVRRIEAIVAGSDLQGSVSVLGAPVAEALLGRHLLADLGLPRRLVGDAGYGSATRGRIGMVPVAIAMMALVFLVAFRGLVPALLPLGEIGACLVVVFGAMGWAGVPVYLTTAVMPVILAAIGAADEIHIFRRYRTLCRRSAPGAAAHRAVVQATLDELASPVVRTSITTAVAFLSFTFSPIGPVRAFGLFTAFGVLVCMALSLTVIPALLVLLRPVGRSVAGGPRDRLTPLFAALSRHVVRHRGAVLVVMAVVAVVCLDGVRRLEVQDSWVDGFAADSDFARSTHRFDAGFLGSHQLLVEVAIEPLQLTGTVPEQALAPHALRLPRPEFDPERLAGCGIRVAFDRAGASGEATGNEDREWKTWIESVAEDGDAVVLSMPRRGGSARFWLHPRPGDELAYAIRSEPFLSPPLLRRIDAFESFLSGLDGVGGVMGPARYLQTVGFMVTPDRPGSRRLPEDPTSSRVFWSNYGAVRGAERLRQVVDRDYERGLITLFLEDANYTRTGALLGEIRDYARERLAPWGVRLGFGGDIAVSQALIEGVVATQVRSVLLSLVGIVLVAALLARSLREGLLCVLPPGFAVLGNFAVMGWAGIPLGVATSMFAGMTLGVGVDYAIHLLARYRLVAQRRSMKEFKELDQISDCPLAAAGPAILIDALAVGLGFGVLSLSAVPANARLGGLLVASLLGCLVATVLIIPALIGAPTTARDAAAEVA